MKERFVSQEAPFRSGISAQPTQGLVAARGRSVGIVEQAARLTGIFPASYPVYRMQNMSESTGEFIGKPEAKPLFTPESLEAPQSFNKSLIEHWAKAVIGSDLEVVYQKPQEGEKRVAFRKDSTGSETLSLPEEPTLQDFVEAASFLRGEKKTERDKKMMHFAKDLQDGSVILASEVNEKGEAVFDSESVVRLYKTGVALENLVTGEKKPEERETGEATYSRLQSLRRALIPPYAREHPDTIDPSSPEYKKLQRQNEDRLRDFLAGGLLQRHFIRLHKRGRIPHEQTYEEWLRENREQMLPAFARLLRMSLAEEGKGTKAVQAHAQEKAGEMLFEAVSERGREKTHALVQERFLHVTPALKEALTKVFGETFTIDQIFAEGKQVVAELSDKPLGEQLSAVNSFVVKAYERSLGNTEHRVVPVEALTKGEFGCTVQALIMAEVVRGIYGDKVVLLADNTWKHMRLIGIEKESMSTGNPRGYFMGAGLTEQEEGKGLALQEEFTEITDEAFLCNVTDTYKKDPHYVHIATELSGKDSVQFGQYHSVSTLETSLEANTWNNMAETGVATSVEEQREFLRRAVALDPLNPTALAQLASIAETPEEQRALLEKARAISPDASCEQNESYAIGRFTPSFTPTDQTIINVIDQINAEIARGHARNPAINNYQDLGYDRVEKIFERVQEIHDHPATSREGRAEASILLIDDLGPHKDELTFEAQQKYRERAPFLTLTPRQIERIQVSREGAMDLLTQELDQFYAATENKRETTSSLVRVLEQKFDAVLQATKDYWATRDPEVVDELEDEHRMRMNHLSARIAYDSRNPEEIERAAGQVGMSDTLKVMNLQDGRVGKMFALGERCLEYARFTQGSLKRELDEDTRKPIIHVDAAGNKHYVYKETFHVTPEMLNRMEGELITQQFDLARKSIQDGRGNVAVGVFGDRYIDIYEHASDDKSKYNDTYIRYEYEQKTEKKRRLGRDLREDITLTEDEEKEVRRRVADDITKKEIRRAIRPAFDALSIQQRIMVIDSRGETEALPQSLIYELSPLDVYKFRKATFIKWGRLVKGQRHLLHNITRFIGAYNLEKEGKLATVTEQEINEVGDEEFDNIAGIADVWSSGWRIQIYINDALDPRLKALGVSEDNIKNFALPLRLKIEKGKKGENDLEKAEIKASELDLLRRMSRWEPETLLKAMRERTPEELEGLMGRDAFNFMDQAFLEAHLSEERLVTPQDTIFTQDARGRDERIANATGVVRSRTQATNRFDAFLDSYGPVLHMLRQEGYRQEPPVQVDFANLNEEQKEIVNRALDDPNAADRLSGMITQMREFLQEEREVNHENVPHRLVMLRDDARFRDWYFRTEDINDALPHLVEKREVRGQHFTPYTEILTPARSSQADPLRRMWGDTRTATVAIGELAEAIGGEPHNLEAMLEHVKKAAFEIYKYNGPDAKAKTIFYILAPALEMFSANELADLLDMKEFFGLRLSEAQKHLGLIAVPLMKEELRNYIIHFEPDLEQADGSREFARYLYKYVDAGPGDILKKKLIVMILIGLLISLRAGLKVAEETAGDFGKAA